MHRFSWWTIIALAAVAVLALACASPTPTSAPTATPTRAPQPTATPTTAAVPAATPTSAATATGTPGGLAAGEESVKIMESASLGRYLADEDGRTLYLFTKDTKGGPSTCYNACATRWPPVVVNVAATAGDGANASLLSTVTRTDGAHQVTYNGWPLYYYAPDTAPGDVKGQNVGGVWFVVSPAGDAIGMTAATTPAAATSTPPATAGVFVKVMETGALGKFLGDGNGRALYLFTKDTKGGPSTCYDTCATRWPPLVSSTGAKAQSDDVNSALLGTAARTDGSMQVTYNGWPLYYYAADTAPGDVKGQNVGSVWFVVSPAGDAIGMAAAAPTSGPSATATPTATKAPVPTAPAPAGVSVKVMEADALGKFLGDGNGRALYLFTKDTKGGPSTCYGGCATAWPPLVSSAGAKAQTDDVNSALLGTVARTDGSMQVTYNGWPLYYYAKDTAPGDVKGQNVGSVWFVVSPAGDAIGMASATPAPAVTQTSASSSPSPTPTPSSGSDYSY